MRTQFTLFGVALLGIAFLAGCGSSIDTLTTSTAKRLIGDSIRRGAAGEIISVQSWDLTVANPSQGNGSARGSVVVETNEATYREDYTITTPAGKTITLIKQVRASGEKIRMEVSAKFILTGMSRWELDGQPKFSVTMDGVGQPKSAFANNYDYNSAEGQRFRQTVEAYNQLITERKVTAARVQKLVQLYEMFVEHDWYNPAISADLVIESFPDEFSSPGEILKVKGPFASMLWKAKLRPLITRKLKEANDRLNDETKRVDALKDQLNQF